MHSPRQPPCWCGTASCWARPFLGGGDFPPYPPHEGASSRDLHLPLFNTFIELLKLFRISSRLSKTMCRIAGTVGPVSPTCMRGARGERKRTAFSQGGILHTSRFSRKHCQVCFHPRRAACTKRGTLSLQTPKLLQPSLASFSQCPPLQPPMLT